MSVRRVKRQALDKDSATLLDVGGVKISTDDLIRDVCRSSLAEFVKEFWDVVIQEPCRWGPHMTVICDECQKLAEAVIAWEPTPYKLLVEVPPGSTKSTIISQMLPAWMWTRMPHAYVLCASGSEMLMEKLARGGKAIIDSEKYQRIFDVPLLIDQSATTNFANNFGGVREGVTVRGSVTGLHAHMVIFDDALDAGTKALSEQEKKVTNYWINATASSRTKDATRTAFIMVGQRICLNDPQSTWRKHADMGLPVRIISLPATTEGRVEPAHLIDIYADDGTLIPDRLPHSELHKKRIVMGDAAYSAQFLQRPISAGTKIFRIDRLKFDIAPSRFKCIVRYWDKAGTLNAGCNTAGVLVAIDYSDRVWILDSVAFQLEPFERNQRIRFVAEIDGQDVPIRFEIEGSSGGKESFQNSVRGLHGWEVTGEYPKGDKGVRAGPFAAQVNAGNVHIAQKLTQDGWVNPVWADSFLEELNNFTGPKSTGLKDQVDAASAGYAFLTEDSGHVAGGLFNNG